MESWDTNKDFLFPDHYTTVPVHLRVEMCFGRYTLVRMEGGGIRIAQLYDELARV